MGFPITPIGYSEQDPANVKITGGTIDNTPIGDVTPDEGTFKPNINLTDGTDTHIIKAVQEDGLGGRLTIGLDETARTMVICDAGDVDTDLGLSAMANPILEIYDNAGDKYTSLLYNEVSLHSGYAYFKYTGGKATLGSYTSSGFNFIQYTGVGEGNVFDEVLGTDVELTDTDGEQSMLYVEPKINQSNTAAYNGIKVNVLETTPGTSIGDGSTGDGNNLLNLQRESVTKMRVDRTGRIILAESTQPSALADHAFFYAKDIAGTAEAFAADAGAVEAQLTAHNDTLFTPDPNERFPWMPYYANHALGVEVGYDMSLALRDLEAITGHKYIHYNDIPVTIDLIKSRRDQWKAQWIKNNITEVEVVKTAALEDYDEEIMDKTMQEVEDKDGNMVLKSIPTQIGEDVAYSLGDDGEVKETKTPKYKMKTIQKKRVKDNIRFDEITGKFFEKKIPTDVEAEIAMKDYTPKALPKYISDRLKAVAEKVK